VGMAKVAVTIEARLLEEIDRWVAAGEYPNRSRAVQAGLLQLQAERTRHQTLLSELAKLDPEAERALADEWLEGETSWPTS
jgi:Arc/MetJ-type ribon-helix-helix transcriptional regulator